MRVKLCGMTRPEDAQWAERLGADAVGLIFAQSPRRVTPEQARAISDALGPLIARVGVFVDAGYDAIRSVLEQVPLDVIQLHGDESPAEVASLRKLGPRIVKSIRVRDSDSLKGLDAYDVDAFLLDAYVPGLAGGTGRTFEWSLAKELAQQHRVILAGGLTPENVPQAIVEVRPYGVDTASGIEARPGIKDRERMRQFIARVRSTDA